MLLNSLRFESSTCYKEETEFQHLVFQASGLKQVFASQEELATKKSNKQQKTIPPNLNNVCSYQQMKGHG